MRILPSWGLGPVEELRRLTILTSFVYVTTGVALVVSNASGVALFTVGVAYLVSLFCVPWLRLKIKRLLITAGQWGIPVVIYGSGVLGRHVYQMLRREQGMGYTPLALLRTDESTGPNEEDDGSDIPVLSPDDPNKPHTAAAIIAMQGMSRQKLIELMEGSMAAYRKVMVIPELFELPSLWVKPRDINGILGLEITSNLLDPFAQFVKTSADLLLVLLTAPFWVPLYVLISLAIWLSAPGKGVFFRQERVGRMGKPFKLWKFRTMVPDAEAVLERNLAKDEMLRKEWESTYKLRKDPRVTWIGRLLRRLSLDELPQLVNVLHGDMSLVGPRPLPAYHHEELSARARDLRERVRPGMTGLWQVSGRSDRGNDGMEQLDSYYVRNWSPWLDMVVLVRTMRAVMGGEGAY